MRSADEIIISCLAELGKAPPLHENECLYRSGILDSADLMQFLLEVEMAIDTRLDLASLVESDVTLKRLRPIIEAAL